MSMRIDSAFEVPVAVDEVWAALLDIERIAPCLPGASIEERLADDQFGGSMRIKLGPVTSTFRGQLRIAEVDDATHRAVIEASARDTRGQGAAAATITSTVEPTGDGTRVAVSTDMKLAGTAAQFGRGVVNDISQKLMAEFASRLADEIQHPAARQTPSVGADEGEPRRPSATSSSGATADDVLDLTAAGREALLARAAPIAAVLAVAAALAVLLGRSGRRHRSAGRAPAIVIEGPLLVVQTRPGRWRRKS